MPATLQPLSLDEYRARAIPRLAEIERLAARINFEDMCWRNTPEGQRYARLLDQQAADEVAAGI